MSDKTRAEHMAWCKARAIAEADAGDPAGAIASMTSDLGKHPETQQHSGRELTIMMLMSGMLSGADEVRRHITGFN